MRHPLRYPLNREFREYLDDTHEWEILTDTRLNILVAKRGTEEAVTYRVTRSAYADLKRMLPPGKLISVYDLHTHPGNRTPTPSPGDMKSFADQKLMQEFGVIEAGYGVITPKGIYIVKLNPSRETLERIKYNFPDDYISLAKKNVAKQLKVKNWDKAVIAAKTVDKTTQAKIMDTSHKNAFRTLIKKHPEVEIVHIRSKQGIRRQRRR